MITTKSSAKEVANHFGVNNISLITVCKLKYLDGGINALDKMKRKPPMNKNNNKEKLKWLSLVNYRIEYESKIA